MYACLTPVRGWCPPLPAERDEGEFARLSQLGDVLGLSQMDVYQVGAGSGRRVHVLRHRQWTACTG